MCHPITEIVTALVDYPNEVSADLLQDDLLQDNEVNSLRIRVACMDIGKVIGKQGRTARSLRTILGAASMKLRKRYALDIQERERLPSQQFGILSVHDDYVLQLRHPHIRSRLSRERCTAPTPERKTDDKPTYQD